MDNADETKVIFRVWKGKDRNVIALFPCVPADNEGRLCQSYEHVGQHGAADYNGVMRRSRLATPEESKELAEELKGRGYRLNAAKRKTQEDDLERWLIRKR